MVHIFSGLLKNRLCCLWGPVPAFFHPHLDVLCPSVLSQYQGEYLHAKTGVNHGLARVFLTWTDRAKIISVCEREQLLSLSNMQSMNRLCYTGGLQTTCHMLNDAYVISAGSDHIAEKTRSEWNGKLWRQSETCWKTLCKTECKSECQAAQKSVLDAISQETGTGPGMPGDLRNRSEPERLRAKAQVVKLCQPTII